MRPSVRLLCVGAASTATAALLSGCGPGDEPASGAQHMLARMQHIAASADPMANPYANDRRVETLEALRTAAGSAADRQRRFDLARERLRAGLTEAAIHDFGRLLAELEEQPATLARADEGQALRAWLGLAQLRLGEQENCLLRHGTCLMPIRESGAHVRQRGSRAAMGTFQEILANRPDDGLRLRTRWLLTLAAMTLGAYPDGLAADVRIPAEAFVSEHDIGRFRDVAPALGIDGVGLSGGAIMEDFDGDGFLDLFMSSWGLLDPVHLFVSNGDGTFSDRTEQAGLGSVTGGLNAKQADYDNDGDVDVLLLRGAWLDGAWCQPNSLLRNEGGGVFVDVTEEAGLLDCHPTQTAAWGDVDGDGWLDLFVGNESAGEAHPCQLFHNSGDGSFRDIASEAGAGVTGYVKGVALGDVDNDGRLDLYVSRLGDRNLLLHNDGIVDGVPRFRDVTAEAGVGEPVHSFPVWFWDYDNDGWLDLWVSGYGPSPRGGVAEVAADTLGLPTPAERPRLYHNRGDGTFAETGVAAGLDVVLYTMGSNFGDLDNDGFPDFYAGTGDPDLRSLVPNHMLRNDGGRRFQDVTTSGGFGHLQKGHGVAFGDLDNDGDQDLFVVMGGAFSGDVYQNLLFENPGHGHHWVTLRLEGVRANRSALGARILLLVADADGLREVHHVVGSGGSFGANSLQAEIGLGRAERILSARILWPGGEQAQPVEGLAVDGVWHIREGENTARAVALPSLVLAPGGDATGHRHTHEGRP